MRARRVRRAESSRGEHRHGRRRSGAFGRTRLGEDGLPRDTFLEQKLSSLHPRVRMKPLHEDVVADHIRQRNEGHALMVREECTDHDGTCGSRCGRVLPVGFEGSAVERLVISESSRQTRSREALQVCRRSRRIDQAGERRRVRCNHELVGQPASEPEPGHAERSVLIVAGAVGERICRLRDAPRHPPLTAVLDLAPHAGAATLIQQRPREGAHQQQGHQVLEHGPAP